MLFFCPLSCIRTNAVSSSVLYYRVLYRFALYCSLPVITVHYIPGSGCAPFFLTAGFWKREGGGCCLSWWGGGGAAGQQSHVLETESCPDGLVELYGGNGQLQYVLDWADVVGSGRYILQLMRLESREHGLSSCDLDGTALWWDCVAVWWDCTAAW
jgi:hypothetical protein